MVAVRVEAAGKGAGAVLARGRRVRGVAGGGGGLGHVGHGEDGAGEAVGGGVLEARRALVVGGPDGREGADLLRVVDADPGVGVLGGLAALEDGRGRDEGGMGRDGGGRGDGAAEGHGADNGGGEHCGRVVDG